jgi:anti-sigma factor (TIGR02949 family)
MIECEQALAELEAFLDGALPAGQRPLMEEHLQACGHCFERKEFRVRVRTVIRRKCRPAVALPPGLDQRIRLILRSEAD